MLTVLCRTGRSCASRPSPVTGEDDVRDDLEGQGVHPPERREVFALGPPLHLVADQTDHEVLVASQRATVEGRHQQLAGAPVLRGVDQQQGVLAHHRSQDRVALAGVEHLGIPGEDRLDVLEPVEQDEVAPLGHQPQREHLAVAPAHRRDEAVPEPQCAEAPQDRRQPRSRRQVAGPHPGSVHPPRPHPREPLLSQVRTRHASSMPPTPSRCCLAAIRFIRAARSRTSWIM
jgi:hypothetical protein